jgi:hypothetical protein
MQMDNSCCEGLEALVESWIRGNWIGERDIKEIASYEEKILRMPSSGM